MNMSEETITPITSTIGNLEINTPITQEKTADTPKDVQTGGEEKQSHPRAIQDANISTSIPQNMDVMGFETLLALLDCKTKTDAAIKLGIDRSTLYWRIDKYKLDDVISTIPKRALQTLQLGSERAADTFVKALDEDKNKMEAAGQILDRVGVISNKNKTLQQFNVSGDMSVEFTE